MGFGHWGGAVCTMLRKEFQNELRHVVMVRFQYCLFQSQRWNSARDESFQEAQFFIMQMPGFNEGLWIFH